MARARRRILIAVSPRVLAGALGAVLDARDIGEVVQVPPGEPVEGRFDLALVSGPTTVDADVVIELLESGTCVVLHREDGDQVIELRDASGLVDVVAERLGASPAGTRER